MKLIFVGSGSAFTVDNNNYNSNMLLVDPTNAKKFLIDCGSDARHALHRQGYSFADIDNVYVSHLHADHAGGLEWLGLTRKFAADCDKPSLFANKDIIHDLWQKTLSGGMMTLQGVEAKLTSFFNVHSINDTKNYFTWNDITFNLVRTIHAFNNEKLIPSYGLFFTVANTKVFITTDTQFTPQELDKFYQAADIIFQDCETTRHPSGVHAHFNQLTQLDSALKAKMWLYHYNSGPLPDAVAQGFRGFVSCGQTFNF